MTADSDLKPSRLMKKHRIFVRPYTDDTRFPPAHKQIFEDIRELGNYRLSSYTTTIDIRSKDEPWRRQTKSRVEWLSKRARTLKEQQRNEAGWRLNLEHHVLHRLQVEVACQKCRSRLWRSEIEPKIEGDLVLEENLAKRRGKRTACSCPLDDRLWDILETGLSSLFEDKAEEFVLQELLLEPTLAKKKHERRRKPDRVFGLRETNNFERILSQVTVQSSGRLAAIRDSVGITPFKDTKEPLLFPFLVLEAKSENSNDGFNDTELQSAFSIRALLELQCQLRKRVPNSTTSGSLVWFLAHRGDNWRVYGCYMTENEPPSYEIVFLWNGSLLLQDDALQLILILDYIVDWARDIYRPSILRLLKSITTGKAYDAVSLVSDSDVHSFRKPIRHWLPSAPSIFDETQQLSERGTPFPSSIPLTHFSASTLRGHRGVIRQSNLVTKKLAGLCLWEANVSQFFHVINDGLKETDKGQTAAREIVGTFSLEQRQKSGRKDEDRYGGVHQRTLKERTLCLTGSELQVLEESWMGETQQADDFPAVPPDERFFCFVSFECYLTSSWEVVKQISYLAVTMPAMNTVQHHARYGRLPPVLPTFLDPWKRTVGDDALRDCMFCLSSASPSQGLLAAIHAKSLALYCRRPPVLDLLIAGLDWKDLIELLEFDIDYSWGQGSVVDKHVKLMQREKMDYQRIQNLSREHRTPVEEQRQSLLQGNFSFCRAGERTDPVLDDKEHIVTDCHRCCQSSMRNFAIFHEPWNNGQIRSMNGMVLVFAPDTNQSSSSEASGEQNICLFVLKHSLPSNAMSLIESTLQNMIAADQMYHAIRSPKRGFSMRFDDEQWPYIMWNLPVPYRHNFPWETDEIRDCLTDQREGQSIVTIQNRDSAGRRSLLRLYKGILYEGKHYEEIHRRILLDAEKGPLASPNTLDPKPESRISPNPTDSRKRSRSSPTSPAKEVDPKSSQKPRAQENAVETDLAVPAQKKRREDRHSGRATSTNDAACTTDAPSTVQGTASSSSSSIRAPPPRRSPRRPLPSSSSSSANYAFSQFIYAPWTAEAEEEEVRLAIELSLVENWPDSRRQQDHGGSSS